MQVLIVFGMSLSGGLKNILCSRYNMLPATYCAAGVYCRQWWKPMHRLANNNKSGYEQREKDRCSFLGCPILQLVLDRGDVCEIRLPLEVPRR
jgi:hypothetical protein